MTFESLSSGTQDLFLTQYSFLAKLFLLSFFFILAYIYIKDFEKGKTFKFKLVSLIRGIYYIVAKAFLFFSPFYILFLAPAVPLDIVLRLFLIPFSINIFLLGIIIFYNTIHYGIAFFTDLVLGENNFSPMAKIIKKIFREEEI